MDPASILDRVTDPDGRTSYARCVEVARALTAEDWVALGVRVRPPLERLANCNSGDLHFARLRDG